MAGEVSIIFERAEQICASTKLVRDKGEIDLAELSLTEDEVKNIYKWILNKIDNKLKWEDVYGGITVAKILCRNCFFDLLSSIGFFEKLKTCIIESQKHEEFRVRIAAGDLMGLFCKLIGSAMFFFYLPVVKQGILDNFERDLCIDDQKQNGNQTSLLHDTAGWKHLETWMKCLQSIISGLGPEKMESVNDSELFVLVFRAVEHANRFVRETGYDLLGILIENHGCYFTGNLNADTPKLLFVKVAKQIAMGLSDNWSQVRMAASRAVRLLFSVPPPPDSDYKDIHSIVLPPMALNRYYVAEGVRIYSQDSWQRITNGCGRQMLQACLPETIDFYISQTDADNHAVREAACAAIAEAGCKLNADLLRPHLARLFDALGVCFEDDSWPVRDAACVALGNLVSAYPADTRRMATVSSDYSDLLADKFLRNLADSIPSVRLGAAQAIAKVIGATLSEDSLPETDDTIRDANKKLRQRFVAFIESHLKGVANQPVESHGAVTDRLAGEGPGASLHIRRTVIDAHDLRCTDQTMYSCGSLAPKMKKGRQRGGCHDGLFQRAAEPWEQADGAVRLMADLAEHAPLAFPDSLVPILVEAASHTQYPHHTYLLETVCRFVQTAAVHLEKARFKRHLDNLLPVLGWAVGCSLPLAACAAEDALAALATKVGPNILRGRIEQHEDANSLALLLSRLPGSLH